ncbi:287_t:CDS:2, partial [Scutellospora calospora]
FGLTMEFSPQTLTISSYLALVLFLVAIVFVIFPVDINIPYSDRLPVIPILHSKHDKKIKFRINLATSPLIAIVILLATRSIGFQVVVRGFVGDEGIQPYSIMILFFALAYICISLDVTGFVEYCAYGFSNRSGNNGKKLFTYFYILFNLMSAFTSNDVVVLTGTIFLVYFTKAANIKPPTAFLISEFVAANIASMTLYVGNPTNVIVAQAYGISFLTYSAWMIIPTIVSMILAYFALYTMFRHSGLIPDKVFTEKLDPSSKLKDRKGAIFGVMVLCCCLIALMGTSFTYISVWEVTLPFAAIMLIRDIYYDLTKKDKVKNIDLKKRNEGLKDNNNKDPSHFDEKEKISERKSDEKEKISDRKSDESEQIIDINDLTNSESDVNNEDNEKIESEKETTKKLISLQIPRPKKKSSDIEISPRSVSPAYYLSSQKKKQSSSMNGSFGSNIKQENEKPIIIGTLEHDSDDPIINGFKNTLPTVYEVVERLPGNLLPFTLGMFILVEALSSLGWISIFAKAIIILTPTYPIAVISIAAISIILCNFLNNLPMTVLLSRVLQDANFDKDPHVTPAIRQGCIYALIIGSNIGACFTIVGALAGLMWDKILRDKGEKIGYWQFVRWNLGVLPVIAVGACGVLIMELWIYYDKLNH